MRVVKDLLYNLLLGTDVIVLAGFYINLKERRVIIKENSYVIMPISIRPYSLYRIETIAMSIVGKVILARSVARIAFSTSVPLAVGRDYEFVPATNVGAFLASGGIVIRSVIDATTGFVEVSNLTS